MGELKKLQIQAYKDLAFSQAAGTYTIQINPETYKHNHKTAFTKNDSTDTAGVTTKFYVQDPQTLTFEFYLDATVAFPTVSAVVPKITSVATEITKLKTVAYSYNGEIHSPNYLKLQWGAGLIFQCRLTQMDIDYSLFAPDGTPLRAKINVSFEEYLSPDEIVKRSKKSSPDLTHARIVQDGDSLPLMCYRIYGDSRHYIRIAEFNRLDNFRRLEVGTQILFPPLGT
jgi:nucleoid-associated protein YgaU